MWLVARYGDFSGIQARLQAGHTLTPSEQAALEKLERGEKVRTHSPNPHVAYETIVTWRWMVEQQGRSASSARSLLAEMMGVKPDAIKARVARATGLGKNFADLCFDAHVQHGVVPALLQHRDVAGHCIACGKFRCRCDPPPRPAFDDTPDGGAIIRTLLAFWNADG